MIIFSFLSSFWSISYFFAIEKLDSFNNIIKIVYKKYHMIIAHMIIASCKLTCSKESNPWTSHFKTMEIKRYKNSFKIEQMVLILGINFLLFSSVKNIWECPKVSCGKFYGNLFGCLLLERFKNEEFLNKRRHSLKISHLLSGLFF